MRLIDADALEKRCFKMHGYGYAKFLALGNIRTAPTIEAEPVKHGRWENHPHAYGFERCSVCHDCNIWGEWADGKKWNFCPNCGAKMDGGIKHESD